MRIILTCSFLFAGTFMLFAGGSGKYKAASMQFDSRMKSEMSQFPFGDIQTTKDSCMMVMTFEVNMNNQIHNIKIQGQNEELTDYVYSVLKDRPFKVDPILDGKKCKVKLLFINEAGPTYL